MLKHIVHSLGYCELEEGHQLNYDIGETNLLQPEMAKLFPNLKKVYIYAGYEDNQCPFSLIGFLKIIQTSNLQHVTIKAKGDYGGFKWYKDWLYVVWPSNGTAIEK